MFARKAWVCVIDMIPRLIPVVAVKCTCMLEFPQGSHDLARDAGGEGAESA